MTTESIEVPGTLATDEPDPIPDPQGSLETTGQRVDIVEAVAYTLEAGERAVCAPLAGVCSIDRTAGTPPVAESACAPHRWR